MNNVLPAEIQSTVHHSPIQATHDTNKELLSLQSAHTKP